MHCELYIFFKLYVYNYYIFYVVVIVYYKMNNQFIRDSLLIKHNMNYFNNHNI